MPPSVDTASAHQERYGVDPSRNAGIRAHSAPRFRNPPTPEWRQAHIGFANSELTFYGVAVWANEWRFAGASPLSLPHPAYPHQIHSYDIYDIGPINQAVRFAAAELSNGVWGFYLPPNPSMSSFDSADGSLRIEQRFYDPFDDREGPSRTWAVVIDAASKRTLVDCSGWELSTTVCNSDGSLDLRLQAHGFDSVFRIRPIARSFANIGEAGPEQPLSALATEVELARRLTGDGQQMPSYRRISPDNTVRVDLYSVEWSNSHWVNSPLVVEIASGRIILDLRNSDWDAAVSFPLAAAVNLAMRRYRGGESVVLELDLRRNVYQLHSAPGLGSAGSTGPITDAVRALRECSLVNDKDVTEDWHGSVVPGDCATTLNSKPKAASRSNAIPTRRMWSRVALILGAVLAAFVLIGMLAKMTNSPATQPLDQVPRMPKS